jgi:hypothetical protein
VIGLARDITATEATPYDRALAIEAFLRRFPYTLDLPQPPQDRDITDYFLFSAQRGYCDYYATAMVVLARAAGLPARLVIGYIGGYFDETLDAYLVTADLAHAWPEIYFPEYGWIIFEPTGGRPEIDRPDSPVPKLNPDYISSFDPLVPEKGSIQVRWWIVILSFIIGTPILGFLILVVDELYLNQLSPQKQLTRIYRRIYRYSHWMGLQNKPGDTPRNFTNKLIYFLNRYGKGSKEAEWLFYGIDILREINRSYYIYLYGPEQNQSIATRDSILQFRQLRPRLLYLLLLVKAYPYRIPRYFLWDSAPMIVSSGPTQS